MSDSPQSDHSIPSPTAHNWQRILQRLWPLAIIVLVSVFVYRQRDELVNAVHLLHTANRFWIIALVICAFALQGTVALALKAVIGVFGPRVPYTEAFVTRAEREMVATVMPFGGIASYVVLVQRFGRYGVTTTTAALATLVYSIVGHLSFLVVAIPTLAWWIISQDSTAIVWVGLVIVIASVSVIGWLTSRLIRGGTLPGPIERHLPQVLRGFRDQASEVELHPVQLIRPLAVSLMGDLFGLLSVWLALRAVGEQQSLMVAAAAYVVGTLLLLAAPVFQGIGFVEASMTIVLQQMGVPIAHALAATLLYRLVDIWLPVVLGAAVQFRSRPTLRGLPSLFPSLWIGANGVLMLASVMPHAIHLRAGTHHLHAPTNDNTFNILAQHNLSHSVSLVGGFLLLLLSFRLLRREHTSWVIAIALSGILTLNHLLAPHGHVAALISGTSVLILLIYRKQFQVRGDFPSLRRGLWLMAGAISIAFTYVVAGLWMADRHVFGSEFSLGRAIRTALDVMIWQEDDSLHPHTRIGEWTQQSFHVILIVAVVYAGSEILRPYIWRARPRQDDTDKAREIILHHGSSSLDRFKFWPDKFQYFPGAAQNAVVSYGVAEGVALVLGEPTVAKPEDLGPVVDEFKEFCRTRNLIPAFHQVPPDHLAVYKDSGFTAVQIGQDAIVDVTDFTLAGGAMKSLRGAMNHAKRENVVVTRHVPPHSPELIQQIREISDEWLTLDGRRERTFTLGQYSDEYMQEGDLLVVHDAEGTPQAFINVIFDGTPGEKTFDLMRHRVTAPNGAMDLLFITFMEETRDAGARAVSLGMVPFSGTDQVQADQGLVGEAVNKLSKPMDRFFSSQSLFDYKDKFHPYWEPRFMVVPNVSVLPRVGIALVALAEVQRSNHPWLEKLHLAGGNDK